MSSSRAWDLRPNWAVYGLGLLALLAVLVGYALNLRLRQGQQSWLGIVARGSHLIQDRVSESNPLREYRLQVDPTVTAESAGQAVHTVLTAGEPRNRERFREPVRLVERSWLPDTLPYQTADNHYAGLEPSRLFPLALQGFDEQMRVTLGEIATHPAFEDYSVAARAGQADLLSARFKLPFSADLDYWKLPIPYAAPIKDAAYAHVARAALAMTDGRFDDAEHDIREVLSFGFLMIDEATSLFDTFIGMMSLRVGSQALEEFLVLTEREAEAISLPELGRNPGTRNADRIAQTPDLQSPAFSHAKRRLYDLVADSTVTRGVRWERMVELAYLPCESLVQTIFGLGEDYQLALSSARRLLLRRDSDSELLRLIMLTPQRAKIPGLSPCAQRR